MVGQISYDASLDRLCVDTLVLHQGQCLDVLLYNGLSGAVEWVSTCVDIGPTGWYLAGIYGYTIPGLFARV